MNNQLALIKQGNDGELNVFTQDGFHNHLLPMGNGMYSLKFQKSKGIRGRKVRYILNKKLQYKKKMHNKYKYHLEIVLYNLLSAYEMSQVLNKQVVVKYHRNERKYAHTGISYTILIRLIDQLKDKGYLGYKKGFYDKDKKSGRIGYMYPTNKLAALDSSDCIELTKSNKVVLKDKHKVEIPYNSSKRTKEFASFLSRLTHLYNNNNNDIYMTLPADINSLADNGWEAFISGGSASDNASPQEEIALTSLSLAMEEADYRNSCEENSYRKGVSNMLATNGGYQLYLRVNYCNIKNLGRGREESIRFNLKNLLNFHMVFNEDFDQGGRIYFNAQNLPKQLRPYITIDGQPTVSLDYSGLHYRILYAKEGINYTKDPYKVEILGWNNSDELRQNMKLVGQCVLNSKSFLSAVKAVEKKCKTGKISIQNGFYPECLVRTFMQYHHRIADHFFTGEGIRLQNEDKDLAIAICEAFIDQGKPILPIHDGFIVRKEDQGRLWDRMVIAYFEKYNYKPIIKLEYDASIGGDSIDETIHIAS